ncbi:DUF952 domain-containing protein [Halomonas sp. C22]|uniref:DUF952 domain-containing protein n=1 Tax=Halomonas sp. C22 TaxID=2580567 RepID=UPI00119E75A9|nr:DUF952 domain-containing protein [Halomonas sp. C22]
MQLYRVITEKNWQAALRLGYVARCGNDKKEDGIHLNLAEAVEYTANRYFTEDEKPLVLVVNTKSFSERIEWRDSTTTEPWQRPLAKIDNLPLNTVLGSNTLALLQHSDNKILKWNKILTKIYL